MEVPLLVSDFIRRASHLYADREAILTEQRRFTYREFRERVDRLSNALIARGVGKGDRVAILSPNTHQYVEAIYGVMNIGAVLVPLNFRLVASDFVYIVNHCDAVVFLVDSEFVPVVDSIRAELPSVRHFISWDADGKAPAIGWQDYETALREASPIEPIVTDIEETDLASVNYTSGTTARPKGVMLTHRNLVLNALCLALHMSVSDRDTHLCITPYFHVNGWGAPFALTGIGARQVIQRKADPVAILNAVKEDGVTMIFMPPAVIGMLLNVPGAADSVRGTRVRIIVGGAPPPAEHIRRLQEECGWEFIQAYGLTETSPFASFGKLKATQVDLPVDQKIRIQTRAGMEMIEAVIRVVDANDHDVPMDDKAIGEVIIRGNNVMKGYWRLPEETAKAIRNGWFYSGDLATWDSERTINIVDRKKDVIISGGENISSIEVEDVLYGHPAVMEVCVIGVPCEKWGETVKAIVVRREDPCATEQEIIAFCRERMAHFKCPTSVDFVDKLPRTATGKLQKFVIRAVYWGDKDRMIN